MNEDDFPDLLRIELKTTLPSAELREEGYPTKSQLQAFWEEGSDVPIATARIAEMDVSYGGDESDGDNAWILDAHSEEADGIHGAIRKNSAMFEDGITGFVLLEGLMVNATERGKGVGSRILRALAEHYGRHDGNPSHLLLTVHPLEDRTGSDRDAPRWKERDPKGFAKAEKRLMAFYARHGFQRLGKTEYMALDLTRKLPPLETAVAP